MDNSSDSEILERIFDFEKYVKKASTEKLIDIVNGMENYEEVSGVLIELSIRKEKELVPLCSKIISEDLGDQYLQAMAFSLFYTENRDEAVKMVLSITPEAPSAVLGAIMDELSMDSLQEYASNFSQDLLIMIVNRYAELSDEDKKCISENYEWFMESYKDKLSK